MNQNPPVPVAPEEERRIQIEEEVRRKAGLAQRTLGRIFTVIGKSRIGESAKTGIKKIVTWLATKAGIKAIAATVSAGIIPAASAAWKTLKKAGKAALAAIASIFMWAAHYGPAGLAGGVAGLIGGAWLGIKAGVATFGALAPFIGPFAAIPGVIVGITVWVGTTFLGASVGIGIQMLWDKITAAFGKATVPQIGASSLAEATAATVTTAKWAVPAAATTATVGGIIVAQVISSAFVIPTEGRPSPWAPQSEYIQVEKTVRFGDEVNPTRKIENSEINENTSFTYQLSITASQAKLTNIRVEDVVTTTQETGTNQIGVKVWDDIPDLNAGETWTPDPYDVPTRPVEKFTDSILANTVTVTADVEEENLTGEQSFASTIVIIGSPPQDCPRGWPVDIRPIRITQGPGGSYTHKGLEAIDIGFGHLDKLPGVKATHKGVAHRDFDSYSGKGNYVSITSTCQGVTFNSLYAHLDSISIRDGDPVEYGTQIGIGGNTGQSTGRHLHYEFTSPGSKIKMAPPYIPVAVPYRDTCQNNTCIYQ